LVIIGILIWFFFIRDEPWDPPASYTDQIETLAEIEANLKNLELFVDARRATLQEQEKILSQLGEEADLVHLFLETERPKVQAILEAQERKYRSDRNWELVATFVLGIIASIVAQLMVRWVVNLRRSKKATDKNT